VPEPGLLVNLANPGPKPGSQSCGQAGDCDEVFSYPMFRDLEERARTGLAGIAAHVAFGANLAYQQQTINARGMLVSGSYFPVLGVRPALGRLLGPGDDRTIAGHFVAVLSHNYWADKLGADPNVLNKTIVINGQPMTIVGITARGFEGTTLGARPDVFVPLTMRGVWSAGSTGSRIAAATGPICSLA
jgi:MacB-like periplasmic core domain